MSEPKDSRPCQVGMSDEELLASHQAVRDQKNFASVRDRTPPLVLLFVFSGLVLFGAVYLIRYSGRFAANVFNENARPSEVHTTLAKLDPIVWGKKNYQLVCFTCHQSNGQGLGNQFPPLAGSEWTTGSPDRLIRIVLHGLTGPVTVKGTRYEANLMPRFGKFAGSGYNWSDEKIAATLTYIRQEWGNRADGISTEQVAAVRAKEGDRLAWTQEELLKIP